MINPSYSLTNYQPERDPSTRPQILLNDVWVDYPARAGVLKGINLSVFHGERIALIGPSGSGKTTLLKTINGLVKIARGEVEIDRGMRSESNNRTRISMVFQEFGLSPRLSVLTNVLIGGLARASNVRAVFGVFPKEDHALAVSLLNAVGLSKHIHRRVDALSSGEKQRVAIARALMQERHVLLADEPVASLDLRTSSSIMALLTALQAEMGFTLLISLHDLDQARNYCTRVVALREGRIVFDGSSHTFDEHAVVDVFGKNELRFDAVA